MTHRLRGTDSGEWGVDDTVLQDFSGSWLPAHIQGVCGGVVCLDVPGRGPHHCCRHEWEQNHKMKESERGELIKR